MHQHTIVPQTYFEASFVKIFNKLNFCTGALIKALGAEHHAFANTADTRS